MLGLSDIAKLRGNVQTGVEQCLAITSRLEHGKAETPLSDPFTAVLDLLEQQQFYMAVIEISPGTASGLLARWGLEADDLWKKLPAAISAVEIRFHAQGYRWQNNGSRLHNADTLQGIFEQVAEAAERGEIARKLLVLYAPGDSLWSSTRILLVRNAEAVMRDPNLMLLLHSSAHLLVICGHVDHELSGAERAALGEIMSSAQAVLPVAWAHEENAASSTWANAVTLGSSCPLLEPVIAVQGQQIDHPVFQAGTAPRIALQYMMLSRQLRDAVERLQVALEQESRSLTARQGALAESERELDENAKVRDPRGELERIKLLVEDGTAVLLEQVDEVNRKATQKKGALTQLVRDISSSISQESLNSVTYVRKIRKSLDPALVAKHTAEITKALRVQLMQDVGVISTKMQEIVSLVQGSLASAGVEKPQVNVPAFEHEKTWQYLQGELSLEGKGELEVDKATGVMFFMNGARSIIMPIFMTLSMVGINLRSQLTKKAAPGQFGEDGSNWFGPALMISGFVLAGLYFFLEKRKERDEQMHRDLTKIQDTLLNDATRMISDVQRDKVSRISSYIGEARKTILRQAEQMLKGRFEQSQRELDRQKREIKAKLRALDAASREQVEFSRQLAKVQQVCAELLGSCAKLLIEVPPARATASAAERTARAPLPERPAREPLPERPPRLSLAERRAMRERG